MNKATYQNVKINYLLQGVLFSYIVTAFILLLLSFLMLKFDVSGMVISGGIHLAYILSTFIGGFSWVKKQNKENFYGDS